MWLKGLHLSEYWGSFVRAGYDMATIATMTPQDLTAIGITNPHHRKQLKEKLKQLQLPDNIPDFIPVSYV